MVLNRIKQFIDYKGIAISAFEKSIGMSNASLGKSLKTGGTIGADKLGIILKTYPEINLYWLVTGEGEMLTNPQSRDEVPEIVEKKTEVNITDRLLAIIEDQKRDTQVLLEMLREKDNEIKRLREELNERKKGVAPSADHSLSANAI